MTEQGFCKARPLLMSSLVAFVMVPLLHLDYSCGQPTQAPGAPAQAKPSGREFTLPSDRAAREIKYGSWQKLCFKVPGTKAVCRTSISGTFETGQTAIRIDLIEKEGEAAARLQMFLPVGLYLQSGVKLTVDRGPTYRVPYIWCLTNTCIAADLANPRLIEEMKTGQKLLLEVVDSNVLTVGTSVPLDQFSVVHQGIPAQTFEQTIDE